MAALNPGSSGGAPRLWLPAGVGAEDPQHRHRCPETLDGLLDHRGIPVAFAVYEEYVLTQGLLGRTGLDLGQVDVAPGELAQGSVQGAGPVLGEGEAEGGFVVASGRMVFFFQDDEAGNV